MFFVIPPEKIVRLNNARLIIFFRLGEELDALCADIQNIKNISLFFL